MKRLGNRSDKIKKTSASRVKQYLTEKQNGYLQSGRSREVVAYEKWSLGERNMHRNMPMIHTFVACDNYKAISKTLFFHAFIII